jgi:transcriptional regulator GlxA family with amidase domain
VSASIEYALMASESPERAAHLTQKLPELLFTEILRLYLESRSPELTGWLAALQDPVVGRALTLLHAHPERDWTVAALATAVAASKTVLVDRFGQLLGRPPIRYLTEWRLNLASGLLRTTRLSVAEIGARVGYRSEEAFSRAFKRELGQAPAHWRATAGA